MGPVYHPLAMPLDRSIANTQVCKKYCETMSGVDSGKDMHAHDAGQL